MPIKKRLSFLFCAIILLGLLAAGCQGAAPPAATATPLSGTATPMRTPTPLQWATDTPAPTPTLTSIPINVDSAALKGTEILLQHSWTGAERKALEDLVAEFNRSNPWGIKARAEQVGDSLALYARLENQLVQANYESLPNLVAAAPEQISSLNNQGSIITNLAPYIADHQYGLSAAEQMAIPDVFWLQDRPLVGLQMGLPAQRNLALLFYNTSWARDLGYSKPPATPEDFRLQTCAAAKAVKDQGNADTAGTGGWIVNIEPWTMMSWLYAFNGVQLPLRASQPYRFNTAGNQKAVAYFYDLFNSSCAWLSRQPSSYDYFARRQALIYSGDLTDIAVQVKMNAHDSVSDQWTVIPYPAAEGTPHVVAGGLSYAVMRHGAVPDLAAWLLARWLDQPEHQALLSKAGGMMPASTTAFVSLADYETAYPQWKEAVGWMSWLQPLPGIASWQPVSQVVSDAGWQVFHPRSTPDSPSTLLDQLDRTVYDVLLHQP